ncbi:MAG: hypothetical protein MJZ34_02705 [Paludibacteraceae bacterium]|nr:hypothetical protein [Paludibacteraceae bacterium]
MTSENFSLVRKIYPDKPLTLKLGTAELEISCEVLSTSEAPDIKYMVFKLENRNSSPVNSCVMDTVELFKTNGESFTELDLLTENHLKVPMCGAKGAKIWEFLVALKSAIVRGIRHRGTNDLDALINELLLLLKSELLKLGLSGVGIRAGHKTLLDSTLKNMFGSTFASTFNGKFPKPILVKESIAQLEPGQSFIFAVVKVDTTNDTTDFVYTLKNIYGSEDDDTFVAAVLTYQADEREREEKKEAKEQASQERWSKTFDDIFKYMMINRGMDIADKAADNL